MIFRKNRIGNLINGLMLISLFIAFYIGNTNKAKHEYACIEKYSDHHITKVENGVSGLLAYASEDSLGYIANYSMQGYGGPVQVFVLTDSSGYIKEIFLGEHSETLAYINKLKRTGYFEQYKGKKLNSKFQLNEDIDAVSGATISSNAIANASRIASHEIAENSFHMEIPEISSKVHFGIKEIIASAIFLFGLLSVLLKNRKFNLIALASSLIAFGFLFNSAISVSHFGRLFLGYIPSIHEHFNWWLLMGGTIVVIAILGRNIYCQSLCPFHGVQIMFNKLSGVNLKLPLKLNKILLKLPKFLLWICLILILISKNSTIASYEPFSMMFSLQGIGIQWYILPAALFGSLVMSNFFCRYFCPVGASFTILIRMRTSMKKVLIRNKNIEAHRMK
jgi:uncharacterized protein with FMN-binding domain